MRVDRASYLSLDLALGLTVVTILGCRSSMDYLTARLNSFT